MGRTDEPMMIDDYLTDLRRRLRGVADVEDVLAEVDDHLQAAAADLVTSRHLDPDLAEQRAVSDYGSPAEVAVGFRRGARQGGAIPTRFTRLSGLAAMATPLMLLVGSLLNRGPAKGAAHGLGVFLQVAAFPVFVVAVAGLIRRHGGLGRMRWTILGLLLVAPVLPFVLSYLGLALAVVALAAALGLLSVGLYRAAILPRPALLLLFSSPAWYALAALVVTIAGGDAGHAWALGVIPALIAFGWFGWVLWRETPLRPVRARANP
jgi:hypothetical protein